ncbi:hypothetical protein K32_47220 [Kaistia sp. 32K]|uniref:hypothetical protein n=1 Tax=Kaistia sp. 32K TaxID=2795690 RepID=UPI001914EB7E|nr:hypothetical protein [Kaistia sp. 32K]BCP56105.1 hypothetical protein K32_47220 [Kaistia sp. 32K]
MKFIVVVALAAILSACTDQTLIRVGYDPASPTVSVPDLKYTPVTVGTVDYRPVEPKSWIERNQNVAPRKGGE